MKKETRGLKFVERYAVSTSQGYKTSDLENSKIRVPPKGHALYDPDGHTTFDELIVREIDADGKFVGDVVVWTDLDRNELFIVEGRGNFFNVKEVNRRRRERGDERMVDLHVKPLDVPLDRAVEHVTLRNFHRTQVTHSRVGREAVKLWRLGKSWKRIAEMLHLELDEPALRKRVPLAYCVTEVCEAVDRGDVPLGQAHLFGGTDLEGKKRLGDEAQRELLVTVLKKRVGGRREKETSSRPVPPAARSRLREALRNGEVSKLKVVDRVAAEAILAYEDRLKGETGALDRWPGLAALVRQAVAPKPPGRPKKDESVVK